MSKVFLVAAVFLSLVFASLGWSDWSASGQPSEIIDGDTLILEGQRVRLYGIDAPEMKQRCAHPDGETWPCGLSAREALRAATRRGKVTCQASEVDRYDRWIAVCTVNGIELNGMLVDRGLAVAFTRYSDAYVEREAAAKEAQVGIWNGEFDMPWVWRANQ